MAAEEANSASTLSALAARWVRGFLPYPMTSLHSVGAIGLPLRGATLPVWRTFGCEPGSYLWRCCGIS